MALLVALQPLYDNASHTLLVAIYDDDGVVASGQEVSNRTTQAMRLFQHKSTSLGAWATRWGGGGF